MKEECIKLLNWMRKNEVNISVDEKGDFAFDIGVHNFSAETLYQKFYSETNKKIEPVRCTECGENVTGCSIFGKCWDCAYEDNNDGNETADGCGPF